MTKSHGLTEMVEEPDTQDGAVSGSDLAHVITAADGLQFGDHHVAFDHRRGLTRIITAPGSKGFLHGLSTAFRPGAAHGRYNQVCRQYVRLQLTTDSHSALDSGAIIKKAAALQFSIGDEAKSMASPVITYLP